jgi:SAM-dependent methyltransferase
MGGLLPEQSEQELTRIYDVLDIACGPGGWVLGMAQAFPDMRVTGFDISEGMIKYAITLAHASELDNAQFQVANAMDPLAFPDVSFDLVNVRQIEEVIPVAAFPPLLKEMVRVTRPGGIIRMTGSEWGVTNSAAFERYMQLILRAARMGGLDFSVDGRNVSITTWLHRLLRDAGCVNIQERPSFWDFSAGSPEHQGGYEMITVSFQLIEPFLVGTGMTTQPEMEELRRQFELEVSDDSFRGIIYTLTAWGRKP